MTDSTTPGSPRNENVCRSRSEIADVLRYLEAGNEPITAHLQGGELHFQSRLRLVDPVGSRILLEPSVEEAVNAALLSRPRCSFFASIQAGCIEFAAADPQKFDHEGKPSIRLRFPDVMVTRQRREFERSRVYPQVPLVCLADAGGILSFQGGLVDVSIGGLGFLVYDPNITLEPGTVLKGCRIDPNTGDPLVLDLEVRYSELVSFPDGTRAERSGCRVVEQNESLQEFVAELSRK